MLTHRGEDQSSAAFAVWQATELPTGWAPPDQRFIGNNAPLEVWRVSVTNLRPRL